MTRTPLTKIGGDGVFVKEIENALAEQRVDAAVHSLKDLPTVQPVGLRLLVPGPREDARDVLITRQATTLAKAVLKRIGTCSMRRTAQLHTLFPDAEILPLRGNVDTRLRKLNDGAYDAIVLASAGLHRLDLQENLAGRLHYLSLDQVLSAPGQGALGLETRDEPELLDLLLPLNDRNVQAATEAERLFMRRLGAGCYLPVAAYASIAASTLSITGLVTSLDGRDQVRVSQSAPWTPVSSVEYAGQVGVDLAEQALAQGADKIITALEERPVEEQQRV